MGEDEASKTARQVLPNPHILKLTLSSSIPIAVARITLSLIMAVILDRLSNILNCRKGSLHAKVVVLIS